MARSIQSQVLVAVVSVWWLTALQASAHEATCAATGNCLAASPATEDTENRRQTQTAINADADGDLELSLLQTQTAINGHSSDTAIAVHKEDATSIAAKKQKVLDLYPLKKDKNAALKKHAQMPLPVAPGQVDAGALEVAVFVPDIGTMCFQGADENQGIYPADHRASPLNSFCAHATWDVGAICADRGFPLLAVEHDACWPELSIWVSRNTTNVNEELNALRQQSVDSITSYTSSHNLPYEFGASWVACSGGPSCSATPVPANAVMWWGANRAYSPEECIGIMDAVVPTIASVTPNIASLTPTNNHICWEGPYDYLMDIANRLSQVPAAAEALFANAPSLVQPITCAARGFASVRDHRDECWMNSAKTMRVETEDDDMGAWVFGGPGWSLRNSLMEYDVQHGLPEFHSIELYTCHVCEPGGANVDRGMLVVLSGILFDGRFTPEYCAGITAGIGQLTAGNTTRHLTAGNATRAHR